MNSAGYRYAASDEAFYIPAVVRHLEPAAFPRDAPLIDGQARLVLVDEALAAIVKTTGVPLQWLFAALYGCTLALLLLAVIRLARRLYRSEWTVVALTAALTLRHSIPKTGANTLEGYFHPRVLVFALGLLGVVAYLDKRDWLWIALVALGALIHPTTAVWFGVWLGLASWIGRPNYRPALAITAGAGALIAVWMFWRGPLAGHLARMDGEWLSAISDKDYLFPFEWPVTAWLVHLAIVAVILWCWRARQRAGVTIAGETPLVVGAAGLLVLFACWLPFDVARIALAVELQVSRIFWLLDVLATIYVVWWLAEGWAGQPRRLNVGRWIAAALIAVSLSRGVYAMFVEFPDRPIIGIDIKAGDWRDAMTWARTTDASSGWLADPLHAALYGSSLRAAGHRDVLLERVKDRAIAMYDRSAALRVADRERALEALRWDTADGARALARRYGLDYLVIDRQLDLPLAHRSGALFIYRLR